MVGSGLTVTNASESEELVMPSVACTLMVYGTLDADPIEFTVHVASAVPHPADTASLPVSQVYVGVLSAPGVYIALNWYACPSSIIVVAGDICTCGDG